MKKLITLFLACILMLAVFGCVCGSQSSAPVTRGELSVAFDKAQTQELLAYFQANQGVVVTGTLLNADTDFQKLSDSAAVALVKDAAVAEKLTAAGWTEAQNWTDAQKEANAGMFGFTVLVAPNMGDSAKLAAKYLTDWLVGDGTYERTVTSVAGGCSCKRVETQVTMKSDAPDLYRSGTFTELVNP